MFPKAVRLPLVLGVAAALAALPSAAHAAPAADHTASAAALRTFDLAGAPGAGLHAGDGSTSWSLSSGTATLNAQDTPGPDERFRIGSQSKTFTAATVLTLVDEGRLELDDPIENRLPGVVSVNGYDGTRITVRHLLRHFSGIPRANTVNAPAQQPGGGHSLASLVQYGLDGAPPAAEPGARFLYSNTAYEILGMLIERLTGQRVEEAVTRRVVQPLGLTNTSFPALGDRTLPGPRINGYAGVRFIGTVFIGTEVTGTHEPSRFYASGAMISTLRDVAAFYRALVGGRVVSAESTAEMKRGVPTQPGSPSSAGLGLVESSCPAAARSGPTTVECRAASPSPASRRTAATRPRSPTPRWACPTSRYPRGTGCSGRRSARAAGADLRAAGPWRPGGAGDGGPRAEASRPERRFVNFEAVDSFFRVAHGRHAEVPSGQHGRYAREWCAGQGGWDSP
ncbi:MULTISPECIES: serine hydrolase domain-containing protein [unclassified Streptomyces]|uniref:serine hydrolase domain-containing protein n=1 Tax=unclassified Streptomyces TaxID=2593676 RepID=UPI003801B9CE